MDSIYLVNLNNNRGGETRPVKGVNKMNKYIVHFRNTGFQIVTAESEQDAMNQISLEADIESCWEYDTGLGQKIIDKNKMKKCHKQKK